MGCCRSSTFLVGSPGALRHAGGNPSPQEVDTVNGFLAEQRRLGPGLEVNSARFRAYARYLGLDPIQDTDLLWIARFGLHAPLPDCWTQHFDSLGRVFFYDASRDQSSWTHPLEQEHRDVRAHLRGARARREGAVAPPSGAVASARPAYEAELRAGLLRAENEVSRLMQEITEHRDENGTSFFHSHRSQHSTWNDPRPAARHRVALWAAALDTLEGRTPQMPWETALPQCREETDLPAWLVKESVEGHEGACGGSTPAGPDPWQSPRLLIEERAVECPICYEPLYQACPSVLLRIDGRRLCGHYFCLACAQQLGLCCPLCRARSPGGCTVRALPEVEKAPRQWFRLVDASGDGRLCKDEVVRALEAVLPLDGERLRHALGVGSAGGASEGRTSTMSEDDAEDLSRSVTEHGWWCQWQPVADEVAGEGLDEEVFCAEGGLLQWIVEHRRELRRSEEQGTPPDLKADELQRWFEFWAAEPAAGLSRPELLRALMRTLGVSGVERRRVREIRGTIEHCFHVWAGPGGGERVPLEAFVKRPGGLGEALLRALRPCAPEEGLGRGPASPPAPPPALRGEEMAAHADRALENTCGIGAPSDNLLLKDKLERLRWISDQCNALAEADSLEPEAVIRL